MTMTMTNMLQNMKTFMDETSKKTTYSLNELKSNGVINTSYFDTKKKALLYARRICDETSTIYIYKTYCFKIYDPVDDMPEECDCVCEFDETYSPELDFSNMTLWSYGKGWLLEPSEDSEFYGKKYFHDGWWMKSQNGWFFKEEHYQWLVDHGAGISEEAEDWPEHEEAKEQYLQCEHTDLSSMTLWSYGKGWLLEPLTSDHHYGEKYFHDGWWMPTQDAWFFKDEHYQWLIEHGAVLATEELENDENDENDEHDETIDISSMKLTSYGKGWLLKPTSKDEHYGEKYFHEGWWMPQKHGWFFKDEHYQWLLEHGVNISKMKTTKTTKTSKTSTADEMTMDLSKMSLEEYGKGYLLKTTKKDTLYGEKYLMNGFWNSGQKGWFFKAKYFDDLVTMGAKFIKTEEDEDELLTNSTELSSSITNDSFEYVHDDSEFMTNANMPVPKFTKYGKGWLLKADSNYKHTKDVDYFEGGWWIPSIKGWFFKTDAKKKFMKTHFEI